MTTENIALENKTKKNKKSWINWFVPSLLLVTALATLVLYPKPQSVEASKKPTKVASTPKKSSSIEEIASTLISSFFNGSDEDRTNQINALEDTLINLKNDATNHTKLAFEHLKKNNINNAIKELTTLANQQKNLRESANTWINIGNIQNLTSADQALRAYQKASELDSNNSIAWSRQGHIHRYLGQFDEAEIVYKKVQAIGNQSTANQAASLENFGLLNQSKGKLRDAEDAFTHALKIYTKIENDEGIASTSKNLASFYKNTKVFGKSEKYYLKALKIHQKLNKFQEIATTHAALGSLYQEMNKPKKALTHYEHALQINQNNNLNDNLSSLYNNLGTLAQQNGELEKSEIYFKKSQELNGENNKESNETIGTADQYGNLAILNRKKNNFIEAEDYHLKAIKIYAKNRHKSGIISQKTNLGFLYKAWRKPQKACQTWKESLQLLKRGNNRAERIKQLIQTTCP